MTFELKYSNDDLRERILNSRLKSIADADFDLMNKKTIKQQVVQSLIDGLNLDKSADTQVRFCSGGEKKRLSLATELIALPGEF